MAKTKKKNPNRVIASRAEVEKARRTAKSQAIEIAWAIMFTVLRDKEGYDAESLQRVWSEVDDLCDSITQGYVTVTDLKDVLKQEINMRFI